MSPDEYCADKAAQRGSSLFYAVLRLPPEKRLAVIAVHAFRREVEDVAAECSDPALGATRLEWWRQQLGAAYDGAPQHPVARALQPVVRMYRLPEACFQEIIEGVAADLAAPRYPDFGALAEYCHRIGAVPNEITAGILGYQEALTVACVRELGLAARMSRIVRDIGRDARRNRIYLPADEMRRFSVTPADLLHQRYSERFQKLAEFQIERIEGRFAKALSDFPAVDRRAQRPILALAAIGRTLLAEIRADGCRVLDRHTSLTPLRKLWIAWRAS
jgi:15-cis-phytoene synthase